MDIVGRVFHVCLTPVQHVQALLLSTWTVKVASRVRHRKYLSDFENVCVPLSQMTRHLLPFEKALVLQQQVGAFFSGEFTKHIDEQAATCRYCGESDSRIHRLRWCPRAAAWRAVFPTLMQQWDELPDYTILCLDLSPSLTGGVSGRLGLTRFPSLNLVDLTPPRSRFFTRIGHVFSRDTRLFAPLQVPPSGRMQMVLFSGHLAWDPSGVMSNHFSCGTIGGFVRPYRVCVTGNRLHGLPVGLPYCNWNPGATQGRSFSRSAV